MARGWESKNVEQQMEEAGAHRSGKVLSAAERDRSQDRDSVELARKQIVARLEKVGDGRQRAMLEAALQDLDSRISKI